MSVNRRGFLSSLAGVVAWAKGPKAKRKIDSLDFSTMGRFNLDSPAASAIQPTCKDPFMWRVDFINGNIAQCEEYLGWYVRADRIARWGDQSILPVMGMDGNVTGMTTYVMCEDWEDRRNRWLSTKPAPHNPVPQQSPFDGYPLGRGMSPRNCHCEDCRSFFYADPCIGAAPIAGVVDFQ